MDILNWLYLAKNKFVRTTLSSTKDLMIFGAKVGFSKRGDKYQNYAMSAEDFTISVADVVKPYKVYTALLTQSGGDNVQDKAVGDFITLGITYYINTNSENANLTVFGAPNSNVGTSFVCTQSGTLPIIGSISLLWNEGAPVVTVLENTIGDVWFTYEEVGDYYANSNELFTEGKTTVFMGPLNNSNTEGYSVLGFNSNSNNQEIRTLAAPATYSDGLLNYTPIEIRVYN